MGLPVDGFIDSATVTTAALGSEQNTIVLELGPPSRSGDRQSIAPGRRPAVGALFIPSGVG